MSNINLIYIGYGLTIINYIVYCYSRFLSNKKDILFLDLFAKACTVVALYCFGSLTGAYNMCLTFVICILCYLKQRNNWKLMPCYWIFQTLFVVVLMKTYIGISSILVFFCSSITLCANWWLSPQHMRLSAVFGSVIYLAYQISIANWAGLLEIFALGSNLFSFLTYRKIEKDMI